LFYTLGSVSFGLQIGGEAAEVVVMCMTQKAVDALMTTKAKLGGDTSIALGPVGGGAKSNLMPDFISFSKSKGIYAGLNLDGSVADVREGLNKAYYGADLTPIQIIVEKEAKNAGASALRASLKKKPLPHLGIPPWRDPGEASFHSPKLKTFKVRGNQSGKIKSLRPGRGHKKPSWNQNSYRYCGYRSYLR